MRRSIVGFHQDEDGDWVAELSCLHNQHVRHRPPFQERSWVLEKKSREDRIGAALDCPLCDRAELPDGLDLVRRAGPFTAETLPPALQNDHRVAERTWGCLHVLEGSVEFFMEGEPPTRFEVGEGGRQAIPPDVLHHVTVVGPVRLEIEFFVRR